MSQSLFREEALLATTGERFGAAMFYQPPAVRLFCVGMLLTFMGFLLFAGFAGFKRTEVARGQLNPLAGAVKVYAARVGVLQEIVAREGQRVDAGQRLAVVSARQFDQEGGATLSFLLQQVDSQLRQLEDEIQLACETAALESEQWRQKVSALQAELVLLGDQQELIESRRSLSEQDYARSSHLHKQGMLPDSLLDQQLDKLYSARQLSRVNLLQIETRGQVLAEAQHQLAMQPLQLRRELLELERARSQLLTRRKEIETQGAFAVTAPAAGVISNLLATQGDTLEPNQPLLSLLPADSQLEAWLYLPSRARGEVALQQEIMLAYDAYPVRTFGAFPATVTFIADTVMDPREVALPHELREPVYLVRARLGKQTIEDTALERLRPGMQFSAQIVTARQTLLQRVFAPLGSLGRKL
ncbi:MAG: HlyD family efflux transporter periplasmic adaptor subunit [Gammaproteobacteria bacterium]|nr:HlyD family efflux transporter periplasmic adaptor subunit [Gammaproteobacteria bacterium]